jgi:chromosomal replication initiator protein
MPHTIWLEARRWLREELPEKDYETWVDPLRAATWSGGVLTIEVPSTFARDWLKHHFMPALERAVTKASGDPASVTLLVNRDLAVPVERTGFPPRRAERPPTAGVLPARFTFETFVVGTSNRIAYEAARAVVAQPGRRYSPLFLYGGCGLGKTHLLNAVANALAFQCPIGTVACLTAENFVNEMIQALKGHRMDRFRQRFRGIRTLVVDDIQFLADKRRSQEEFCHTFNALHDVSRQIVLASDRAPQEMPGIESALRDRFASGLLAEIEAPDETLRLALVERKAEAVGLALPPDVASALARDWTANVRVLEGALTRLDAYATLAGRPVTLELLRQVLGSSDARNGSPSPGRIIDAVCAHYQLSRAEIASVRRTARVAEPRQLAMYLCRQHTDLPLNQIGAELGGRDHSTVVHALAAVERRLAKDITLRQAVSTLRSRLLG